MSPGQSPDVIRSEPDGSVAAARLGLIAILLLGLAGCAELERVQRDAPKSRLTVGLLTGEAEDTDLGGPDIQSYRVKYVASTEPQLGSEDGWTPAFYGEAEYWDAARSGYPDARFYDVCLGMRSVDVFTGSIASRQRFRLPCEVGTNWSELQVSNSEGGQWDFIPILSYRLALEPELLLVITSNSELSVFANAGITGGLVVVQNGEDTGGWQSNLTVGARYFYRKVAMELAWSERRVRVSSTTTEDLVTEVPGEEVTFSGLLLSFGMTF